MSSSSGTRTSRGSSSLDELTYEKTIETDIFGNKDADSGGTPDGTATPTDGGPTPTPTDVLDEPEPDPDPTPTDDDLLE